jgi:hypothetical protein
MILLIVLKKVILYSLHEGACEILIKLNKALQRLFIVLIEP